MKFNKWTVGLAAIGVISLSSAARADEKMSQLQTALSNTTISGYVDTAATWRPGTDQNANSDGAHIPYYSFAKNDGFSLNAVDIAIDHPEDESPWAAGYHVELMFGPDSEPDSSGLGAANAYNIRQAYLTLRTPIGNSGIDWKVGVWDTIIGYESTSDPSNPNYTRSYGYTIEPTTHTGVLGTYKVNDEISVQAGIADGSNVGFGPTAINGTSTYESQKAYMGAVALTAPSSWGWLNGATLNAGIIDEESATSGFSFHPHPEGETSYYVGATIPTPLTALKGGASFDYLAGHDGLGDVWVGALYASYQLNDKASVNLRGEYGQDDTGLLYGDYDTYPVGVARNTFEEFTATLQYNLWANVLSRVEFRWDHAEHGNAFGTGATSGGEGFSAPDRNNDFMLALNLIYQF
ncbi:MAG: outer membrane beta-barrel protein [Limisphaerales bacterium]